MKTMGKFVIFREENNNFLMSVQAMPAKQSEKANLLLWATDPMGALKYDSLSKAREEAQRIANHQAYTLIVCELFDAEEQVATIDKVKVLPQPKNPKGDPNLN